MAKEKPPPTFWNRNDEAILVSIVKEHKILGNFADNNPKKIVWTAIEMALAGSEKKSGGAPKTCTAIKNRWQRLKKEYEIVKDIREKSGLGWDNVNHLPEFDLEIWDVYVKGHPKAKPYRTKPFPLFDDIAEIVGGMRASGKRAYRGGQTQGDPDTLTGTPQCVIDPSLLAPMASSDDEEAPTFDSQHTMSSFMQSSAAQSSFSQSLAAQSSFTQSSVAQSSFTQSSVAQTAVASSSFHTEAGIHSNHPTSSSKKGKRRATMEIDDDTIDQDTDQPDQDDTSAESRHQRSKSSGSTGNERRKLRRISAGQGMITGAATLGEYILNALKDMTTEIIHAKTEDTQAEAAGGAGPSRQTQPVEQRATKTAFNAAYFAINDNEGLSDTDMALVGDILRRDPDIGTTYLDMPADRPRVRTYFLQARLEEYLDSKKN